MKQKRYSDEQRRWAVEQLSPPLSRGIVEVSRESGITTVTLRTWRKAAIAAGQVSEQSNADGWSSASKFRAVLEAAALSEAELSEYCRRKAILPEQLRQWRAACEGANGDGKPAQSCTPVVSPATTQRVRELERELRRKDAALAEAAALLMLRKKADAIWGMGEDE
jgi:transposase-like protein